VELFDRGGFSCGVRSLGFPVLVHLFFSPTGTIADNSSLEVVISFLLIRVYFLSTRGCTVGLAGSAASVGRDCFFLPLIPSQG